VYQGVKNLRVTGFMNDFTGYKAGRQTQRHYSKRNYPGCLYVALEREIEGGA
jgi:hypothetical protein